MEKIIQAASRGRTTERIQEEEKEGTEVRRGGEEFCTDKEPACQENGEEKRGAQHVI